MREFLFIFVVSSIFYSILVPMVLFLLLLFFFFFSFFFFFVTFQPHFNKSKAKGKRQRVSATRCVPDQDEPAEAQQKVPTQTSQ